MTVTNNKLLARAVLMIALVASPAGAATQVSDQELMTQVLQVPAISAQKIIA